MLLLTLAAAALGALPASSLSPALGAGLGHTLAGDHLLRNDPALAPEDAIDFLRRNWPAVAGWGRQTIWAALAGVLIQAFFAGGIVETLGRRRGRAPDAFWSASRRHVAHNVRCVALAALAAGVVVGAWLAAAGAVQHAAFRGAPPHSPGRAAFRLAILAGTMLLAGGIVLLLDFARAARRYSPRIGAVAAFRDARRRLRRRWASGLAALFFWAAAGGGALALLFSAAWSLKTPTGVAVVIDLALLACTLAVLPAARVATWGSILALYDRTEEELREALRNRAFEDRRTEDLPPSRSPVGNAVFPAEV